MKSREAFTVKRYQDISPREAVCPVTKKKRSWLLQKLKMDEPGAQIVGTGATRKGLH